MKKKTILIFSGYYIPYLGGIERYLENLMRELVKMGHKPILVTSNHDNGKEYEIYEGKTIIKIPIFNIFKKRYPIPKPGKKQKELLKLINPKEIDAVILNTRFHLNSHIGAKYAEKNNIPAYLIEHGADYVTLDNKFIDFIANRYEKFLTYLIKKRVKNFYGGSSACAEWIKEFGIESKGVWYNAINQDIPIYPKKKDEYIRFIFAGRLIKQKGAEETLQCFIELEKKYKNIKLEIAGIGPELEKYKEKYQSKNIKYLGYIEQKKLFKHYAKADISLTPSMWPEGFVATILEAGLQKCAIIATNQKSIIEMINDECGLIINPNKKELLEAMEKLILDKKLRERLAKNFNKRVIERYTWEKTAKKIIEDISK